MRYESDEEKKLLEIFRPYLKYDNRGCSYLPDDAPQEAKEAKKKAQEIIFERKKEEWEFF